MAEEQLKGFHIVVDAGNGAGVFFAGKVLEPLGAVISGSQFLEPDDLSENMEAILKYLENFVDLDEKLWKVPVNYRGVRVSGFEGWFLLRLNPRSCSSYEYCPTNIIGKSRFFQAPSPEDAVKIGLVVSAAVKEFSALDFSRQVCSTSVSINSRGAWSTIGGGAAELLPHDPKQVQVAIPRSVLFDPSLTV
ncbi:hypothetical protein SAY87_023092 [Trapa incisa]|uniref:Uncharacterized protein n=1 Tax=Trapa incisa TaxID=236973 RepID=A0AAN7Q583_9MYRT|nr:hypothetical protein SAY87_023092 [Trapa incisa]